MQKFWTKLMRLGVTYCCLVAIGELATLAPSRAGENRYDQACPNTGLYDVTKFVEESKKPKTAIKDFFKQLPKDVHVIHEQHKYVAAKVGPLVYFAPNVGATPFFGMRPPFEFQSPCGVRDANNEYWIVYVAEDGTVGYLQPREVDLVK